MSKGRGRNAKLNSVNAKLSFSDAELNFSSAELSFSNAELNFSSAKLNMGHVIRVICDRKELVEVLFVGLSFRNKMRGKPPASLSLNTLLKRWYETSNGVRPAFA